MTPPAYPRAMADPAVREQRLSMVNEPHIKPLTDYADSLGIASGLEVPKAARCTISAEGRTEATIANR